MHTAKIKVTQSKAGFVNFLTKARRYSKARFTLKNPSTKVAQVTSGEGNFVVKGPAQFVFYFPVSDGIIPLYPYFVQTAGGKDPTGVVNFPLKDRFVVKNGQNYEVWFTDAWKQRGHPKTVCWQYYIAVQNKLGRLGIIHPEITNEN